MSKNYSLIQNKNIRNIIDKIIVKLLLTEALCKE